MYGIFSLVSVHVAEIRPDSARLGVFRKSRPHQFPVFQYRIVAFQYLYQDRAGCHEFNQFLVKWTLFMNGIKVRGTSRWAPR